MHNWFLVVSSVLLFSSAFLWSTYCWWTIFIFFIPLWHLFKAGKSSFCKGFMWGIICWTLQLSAILMFLLQHGTGSVILRLSAWMLLILYLSVYAGMWFWVIKIALQFFCIAALRLLIMICVSVSYFYWIDRAAFFIFGRTFGYPFSNPLIPLMVVIGLLHNQEQNDGWKNLIEVVTPPNHKSAWQQAYDFLELCKHVAVEKPDIKVIITPESAFPFPLNLYPEFIALWSEYPSLEKIHFLIGAHRQEGSKLFNTLYYIHQGRIIQYYDKKTTLLIAEELPTNKFWKWTQKLFLEGKHEICGSANKREAIIIDGLPKLLPYICSDLFFCYEKPKRDDAIILCIANDSWFSLKYMKRLMALYVGLQAYKWQKYIIHVC